MENNHESVVISIQNDNSNPLDDDDQPKLKPIQLHPSGTRKRGPMNVLRVALLRMRGRSRKSNSVKEEKDESNTSWKKVVGSMRPLHLQSTNNQSPRSFSEPATSPASPASTECKSDAGGYVSDFPMEEEPYSPSPPSSRYASAVGLNEMFQSDEDNEKQEVITEECNEEHVVGVDGDEMIDAKAEEFIAHFYSQMKLQRLDSIDRRYIERSERSLGC